MVVTAPPNSPVAPGDWRASYQEAIRLKPDYADAHKNLGLAYLAKGEWGPGWREYEWRWRTRELPARNFSQPRWEGQSLEGKRLLVYAEQGLGDPRTVAVHSGFYLEVVGK